LEQSIKQLLDKYNIKPSKRLGQNFLIDNSVLQKTINAAELSKNDIVLEIGPGLGTLTMELAKRTKQVIAVEKDEKMCKILQEVLDVKNVRNVRVINNDILKVRSSEFEVQSYKIVANLPYYIASPVIRMFLETENKPESMILMVQKEVAQRICAKPGQMSILAVAIQFYARPEIVSEVLKTSFYPQPKVDSAIIKITPKNNLPKINIENFFSLIKAGFSSKRKFLISNLSRELSARGGSAFGGKIENCKLKIVFDQARLGQKMRAENLSVDDWMNIYEKIKNIL